MSVYTGPPVGAFEFGPFSLDATTGELRKRGIRVRLSGQPLRILSILLSRPGEVVTREDLRSRLWDEQTFVDFEAGLNAAIAKLRRALDDSAEHPRYIDTIPGVGYRFIGSVERLRPAPAPTQTVERSESKSSSRKDVVRVASLTGSIVLAAVYVSVAWQRNHITAADAPSMLLRLTTEAGFSGTPAISPDGKLLAYSSDQNRDEGLDLFVRQISGGKPVRLTFDGADNTTPDFSPDGGSIVFRSGRNGGGIYEIPTFGGDPRLIAHGGFNPRYSPDGSRVAYWVGDSALSPAVPGSGQVWVARRSGEQPKLIAPDLTAARFPIWSPDGTSLIFIGYSSKRAHDGSAVDWWLASANGSRVVKTDTLQYLVEAGVVPRDFGRDRSFTDGFPFLPPPSCWLAASNTVIFSARKGDTSDVWETGFSVSQARPSGKVRRLTTGSGNEEELSCSQTAIALTNVDTWNNVWSVRLDANAGRTKGSLERVNEGPGDRKGPSLSENGRYLTFSSAQTGRLNIWIRDLLTGKELQVTKSALVHKYPEISGSGAKIAYSVIELNGGRSVYVTAPEGVSEKICDKRFRATGWSHDEKAVLVFLGNPYRIQLLDIASHRQTPVVSHPAHHLLYARFSPDDRWISFTERIEPNRGRILLAPMDRQRPIPESAWIQISEEGPQDWASWSPDSKILYFHLVQRRTSLRLGAAYRPRVPASERRSIRGTPSARATILRRRWLDRCSRRSDDGTCAEDREHLADPAAKVMASRPDSGRIVRELTTASHPQVKKRARDFSCEFQLLNQYRLT